MAGALAACATPAEPGPAPPRRPRSRPARPTRSAWTPSKPLEVWIFDGGFGDAYATDIHQPLFKTKYPERGDQAQRDQGDHQGPPAALRRRQPAGGHRQLRRQRHGLRRAGPGRPARRTSPRCCDAPSWDDPAVKVQGHHRPGRDRVRHLRRQVQRARLRQLHLRHLVLAEGSSGDNGWQVPNDLGRVPQALCETIKKSGKMAPFTYAGKHPHYLYEPLLTMAAKIGGNEVLVNIDNLEDGAWKAEPMKTAADGLGRGRRQIPDAGHRRPRPRPDADRAEQVPGGHAALRVLAGERAEDHHPGRLRATRMFPMPDFDRLRRDAVRHPAHPAGRGVHRPGQGAPTRRAGMEYLRAMLSKKGGRQLQRAGLTRHRGQGRGGGPRALARR